jgi:V/A-type H+-transporting ATPase subunit D
MPRIKHTKNELKTQREALQRYERFLPMLQLKKQQLQAEILATDGRIEGKRNEQRTVREGMANWMRLFSEPVDLASLVRVSRVNRGEANIAGVAIPVFEGIEFDPAELDLFLTPSWLDDAVSVLEQLMRLRVEQDILQEQRKLIADELRTTNQRVNLFEKVKIPEARENIRVIKIFLGDEQTAGVVRAKIAKSRTWELESDGVRHAPAMAGVEEAGETEADQGAR